jgi:hypothetical protein
MPPRDVFTGGPTREQQERLEAQTGGRRGSTVQDRYDRSADTSTRATRGASGPMGGFGPPVDFSSGSGEKAGTLSQQEFMNVTGRTETNPYGNEGFFSRVFGIDPSKINYAANTPGGIATLNKVNALAYDQYMNPRDARGNIRGFLREGSPTRFGTVTYDPTLETDLGIMGALPLVGPLMQRANRRSALNISSYDNPLFSEMGDLGNELGAFPEGSVAAAPAAQAAQTGAVSDVFTPFTTDPEERNLIEEDFEVDRRATDEDSPFSRPVPESTYRPLFTDDVTVADVIANTPMATAPVAGSVLVNPGPTVTTPETENQRIMRERQEAVDAALRRRQQESSAFVDRTNTIFDEIERIGTRIDQRATGQGLPEQMDAFDEELLSRALDLPGFNASDPFDLVATIPPPPMMTPTPKPSRGPTAAELAFAAQLKADLARRKAMR